jgi:hypothetical protein
VDAQRLDRILRTHLIEPVTLRNDAFDTFVRDRATKLLDLIEKATGKQVTGRDSDETISAFGSALLSAAPADQATAAASA